MSVVGTSIVEPAWKVTSSFVPQITSTCDGDEVEGSMGRAVTGSTDCSEDSTTRHQRLWARALDSRWKLSRTDFKMKKELSRTLKSTLQPRRQGDFRRALARDRSAVVAATS